MRSVSVLLLVLLSVAVRAAEPTVLVAIDDRATRVALSDHARGVLASRFITVVEDRKALTNFLRESNGAPVVIVDGSESLLDVGEATKAADALVARHGPDATYIFLETPSSVWFPGQDWVGNPAERALLGLGPVNAAGHVDLALARKKDSKSRRLTLVESHRATELFGDAERQGDGVHSADKTLRWRAGQRLAFLAQSPFDTRMGVMSPVMEAVVTASNEGKLKYVAYEVVGGERPIVAQRLFAFGATLAQRVTKAQELRIHLSHIGDDRRSVVSRLASTQTNWLAEMLGREESKLTPKVTEGDLYRPAKPPGSVGDAALPSLSADRELAYSYETSTMFFGRKTAVARFKVRYDGKHVWIDSPESHPAIKLHTSRPLELKGEPVSLKKGLTSIESWSGPVAELTIDIPGQALQGLVLVDGRQRESLEDFWYSGAETDLPVLARKTFTENTKDSAIAVAPTGTSNAPVVRRPVVEIDRTALEPLREFFPLLAEEKIDEKKASELPYELPSRTMLANFERTMFESQKGLIVFITPEGMSKNEMLQRLLYEVRSGAVPGFSRNQPFNELRSSLIGSKWVNESETRLDAINIASKTTPVRLINFDLSTLEDFGRHTNSTTNSLTALLQSMEKGRVTMITATTENGLERFLLKNPQFRSVLGRIEVPELTEAYIYKTMDALADRKGRPRITDALKNEFVEISDRFSARGGHPERALDFLSAYFGLSDELRFEEVNVANIRKAAERHFGVTSDEFDPALRLERQQRVASLLNENIIGMDLVKSRLIGLLERERRGRFRTAPFPNLLLAGPPGLAKTVISKMYAEGVVGDRFKRIDLSGAAKNNVDVLYRQIADAVSRNADVVILLDELEKAADHVQEALLIPVLERTLSYRREGSSELETVSLRSVRFLAASNAGTEYLQRCQGRKFNAEQFEAWSQQGRGDLYLQTHFHEPTFRAELSQKLIKPLISRFADDIYPVHPLTQEEFSRLVELKVEKLAKLSSADRFVGPVKVVDTKAFSEKFTRETWAWDIDIRTVEGRIARQFDEAMGRAEDRQGRVIGQPPPPGCDPLLVRMNEG